MSGNLPCALVNGTHHFAAEKLVEKVLENEIEVIGIGEGIYRGGEKKNFRVVNAVEEVEREVSYVFDFVGEERIWRAASDFGSRLTVVAVNNKNLAEIEKNKTGEILGNWRLIEGYGVYGPKMTLVDEEGDGIEFLIKAIRQAVNNQNLTLPPVSAGFRLLCVDDFIEAVLRASFLSGTQGRNFLAAGKEINSEEVARALIEEAKMTRYKVLQEDLELINFEKEEVENNWRDLRWEPVIGFKDGIRETLRYYFEKIDEEKRRVVNNKQQKVSSKQQEEEIGRSKLFEVEVEELVNNQQEIERGEEVIEEMDHESIEKMEIGNETEEVNEAEEIEEVEEIENELQESEEEEKEEDIVVGKKIDFEEIKPLIGKVYKKERLVVREEEDEKDEEENEEKRIEEIEREVFKKEEVSAGKKKINFNFMWWIFLLMMIGLMWIPMRWAWIGYSASGNIKKIGEQIVEKKYTEAEKLAEDNYQSLKTVEMQIDDWGLNRIKILRDYQTGLRIGEEVFVLEKELIGLAKSGTVMSEGIFGEKEVEWDKELAEFRRELTQVNTRLGILQARLGGNWSWLPTKYRNLLSKGKGQLAEVSKDLESSSKVVDFLPEFIGTDGKRREYMVLLQNENELRPGGGFIGSFGILSFEGGRLLNFEIKDIYEADGQLKGHVEPPEEIKTYLGEAGWYMRDANFNPNFRQSSKDIQWFLEKELGRKVDGVIGVNLTVAKGILGVIGEIYVADFKEKINKDNLYEQAEFYAETKFFPGSNQKASFLSGVGRELFNKIRELKIEQQLSLYREMVNLLEKNEIQIALNNQKAAMVVADLGWDGAIYEGKCGIDRCFADYLYVLEANLGVNKANYFLYRNIEQIVDIKEKSVERIARISYENTAKNNNWPGGDYKNYLRVYISSTSEIVQVSVSDPDVQNSVKIYAASELRIKQVGGKKEVGFLVTVPVLKRRKVEIKYIDKINLTGKDKFSYLHYIQRQSGFGDTGLVTLISFPDGWQPNQVEPVASVVGGKLLFNQKLDEDIKMGVEISK